MSENGTRKSSPRKGSHAVGKAERVEQVEVRMDGDRLADKLQVDEYIALGEISAMTPATLRLLTDVMGRFVWRNGAYLSDEDGRALLGKASMRQLGELLQVFMASIQETAVPEASGGDSETA